MKVSVVIPTYNRAHIIDEALQSVFAQAFSDFEVVVVDDGSIDNTAAVIERIRDKRLRYIRQQPNAGHAVACNTGIHAAQGEYLSILDSDDLWKPEKMEAEVRFLDIHPEVEAVFTDLEKLDSGRFYPSFMRDSPNFSRFLKDIGPEKERVFTQRECYLCLLEEVFIKPTAVTFRREALLRTPLFAVGWPSGDDWKLLLDFSRSFRYGYIDRPLAVLRVQSDSIHWLAFERDKALITQMLLDEIKAVSRDKEAVKAARWGISNLAKQLGWYYLGHGQRLAAAKAFFAGYRNSRDLGLLIRGAAALLPKSLRSGAKRILGRRNEVFLPGSNAQKE